MPQPPDVGLFTRYVLENPYALGIGLLVVALIVGWLGLRDGRRDRMVAALVSLLLAAGVLIAGLTIVTSGEHGRRVTRSLVEAVTAKDLVAADNLIADDAQLQLGATTNISHDRDVIIDGLSRFADRYTIQDNRITMLDGYSESRQAATVHLACWTEATGYGFYTPSQWVLRIERQDDGVWKVARITCISINSEPPPALP
jgi:hypothetical protein